MTFLSIAFREVLTVLPDSQTFGGFVSFANAFPTMDCSVKLYSKEQNEDYN
jgi:hypothetical protein